MNKIFFYSLLLAFVFAGTHGVFGVEAAAAIPAHHIDKKDVAQRHPESMLLLNKPACPGPGYPWPC